MKNFYSIVATVAVAVGMIALVAQMQAAANPTAAPTDAVTAAAPANNARALTETDMTEVRVAPFSQSLAPTVEFPLMDDAAVVPLSDTRGTTSYQTKYTLEEVMAFYRAELGANGATERSDATKQDESSRGSFRMVFDNWQPANGASVVVEGATVNADLRVITLRLETNP